MRHLRDQIQAAGALAPPIVGPEHEEGVLAFCYPVATTPGTDFYVVAAAGQLGRSALAWPFFEVL